MKYELIKQLIAGVEEFEREPESSAGGDMARFVAWLNQKYLAHNQSVTNDFHNREGRESPDTLIGILVTFVYRYARAYSKKGLENSPLLTFDDFTYLATLLENQPMTKIELIERNIHEKTTGTEIIRRLLVNNLIAQADNPDDRRSKRLTVTPDGLALLGRMWPVMGQVSVLVGGSLTVDEKMQLVYLLEKLHAFHNPIYLQQRGTSLPDLLQTNLPPNQSV